MFSSFGRGRNFLVFTRNTMEAFQAQRNRGDAQNDGQDVNCLEDRKRTLLWVDKVS